MKFKIIERTAFSIIGAKRHLSIAENSSDFKNFWRDIGEDGTLSELEQLTDHSIPGILSAIDNHDEEAKTMDVWLGRTADGTSQGHDLEQIDYPAMRWLVVEVTGPAMTSMISGWGEALNNIIPSNQFKIAELPAFEAYISSELDAEDSVNEIWFPLAD